MKSLTLVKLGREIQNAGKKGHCSLEDAIATRDLVHWYITNPSILVEELGKMMTAKLRPSSESRSICKEEDIEAEDRVVAAEEVSLLD